MATQDYAASIQGVAIRVTRLDADGDLLNGAGDSYTTSAFMRVSFTPEYEEGDEFTEKSANGAVCVTYKSPDTLKRITMELAICEPDPELSALLSGGLLLRKNTGSAVQSIGWAAPAVGDDPAGNGVSIEAWSIAVKDGRKAASYPYFHWVFPFAKLRQSGDRVIENGMLATTFEGYGLGNVAFDFGPDNRWEFPQASDRPYSYARSTWAPTGLKGFYTWGVTDICTGVTVAAGQLTITTDGAHGFRVGDEITLSAFTATVINRTYTITEVPTATTFKVATAETTVSTSTGSVLNYGAYAEVATGSLDNDIAINVPGNVDFNADNMINNVVDNIVVAQTGPTGAP
jgi:hypothetical protein